MEKEDEIIQEALYAVSEAKIENCYLDLAHRSITLILTNWVDGARQAMTLRFVGVAHCLFFSPPPGYATDLPRQPPLSSHDPSVAAEISGIGYKPGGSAIRIDYASRGASEDTSTLRSAIAIEIDIVGREMLFQADFVEINGVSYALR